MQSVYKFAMTQVIIAGLVAAFYGSCFAGITQITGNVGSSSQWGSGWIELSPMQNFKSGDRLRLTIGGSAQNILIRLFSTGQSPDQPVGILPGKAAVKGNAFAIPVPKNRIVVVELDSAYSNVLQISVHGGPNPWGQFPLGFSNGPATIIKADLIR